MESSQESNRVAQEGSIQRVLGRLRLTDPKTDLFLSANVMDAILTYVALQHGSSLIEFNPIVYTAMNTVGTGTALFLKVVLCIGILWILRKTKREKLLVPLAVVFVVVALANLMVMRAHGVEV